MILYCGINFIPDLQTLCISVYAFSPSANFFSCVVFMGHINYWDMLAESFIQSIYYIKHHTCIMKSVPLSEDPGNQGRDKRRRVWPPSSELAHTTPNQSRVTDSRIWQPQPSSTMKSTGAQSPKSTHKAHGEMTSKLATPTM